MPDAVTLNWDGVNLANRAGYYVLLNGTRIADVTGSPFTFTGLAAGTEYTLGVQAHDSGSGVSATYSTTYTTPTGGPGWPTSVDSGGRFVKDQNGAPWFMFGVALFDVLSNPSQATAETVISTLQGNGCNLIWIALLTDAYLSATSGDAMTDVNGHLPFTGTSGSPPTLNTPNSTNAVSAYWSSVDAIVSYCEGIGVTVAMMPVETGGAAISMASSSWGTTGCNTYGQFLGNRYKNSPNILWYHGNDFGTNHPWATGGESSTDDSNDALMENIYSGIKTAGDTHLHTIELNYDYSLSADDGTTGGWRGLIDLNQTYTYYQTYDIMQKAWLGILSSDATSHAQRYTPKPVFLGESNYEGGDNVGGNAHPAGPYCLRLQNYWTVLAGGLVGQVWGQEGMYQFGTYNASSTSVVQAGYWASFFRSIAFQKLVPDFGHSVVTSGYGTYDGTFTVNGSNTTDLVTTKAAAKSATYVTAAAAADGSLMVAYTPVSNSMVVDMTKMRGTTTAQWFDPTNNSYTTISSSLSNTGTHTFTPSGNNNAGDPDWVLLLTA